MNINFGKTTAAAAVAAIPFIHPLMKADANDQIPSLAFLNCQTMEVDTMPFSKATSLQSQNVNATKQAPDVGLSAEFQKLVKQWKDETFFHSSLTKMFSHPAYQRIMAMGKEGLPFVFRELQNSNDSWFYALKFMAGKDIAAGIKNVEAAKAAWLEWGYNNNYI